MRMLRTGNRIREELILAVIARHDTDLNSESLDLDPSALAIELFHIPDFSSTNIVTYMMRLTISVLHYVLGAEHSTGTNLFNA